MRTIIFSVILIISSMQFAVSQPSMNELNPSEYFDFWIGEWDLTWEDRNGDTGKGINKVEYVLNDRVIKENFEAVSGQLAGYVGKSYSVYDPKNNQWQQTWVDNQGAYLDFTGSFEGENRIFVRQKIDASQDTVLQRMVFYDIKKDSFFWRWEKSTDNGKNWTLQWKIAYRRH